MPVAADQLFRSAHHRPPPRLHGHDQDHGEEGAGGSADGDDDLPGYAVTRNVGIQQHYRADDEGDHAADAQGAESGHERLGDHEGETEKDKPGAGEIDGEQVKREQAQKQAYGPDHARRDETRVHELEDQSIDADEQQDIGQVGIGDGGQQLGAPVGLHGDDGGPGRVKLGFLVEHRNLASVHLLQKLLQVPGHQVDHPGLQGLLGGKAGRLGDGFLRPLGVAAAHLGQAANVGHGIVQDLVGHGRVGRGFRRFRFRLPRIFSFFAVFLSALVFSTLFVGGRRRRAADLDRGRRAQVGARSHGRHGARIQNIRAGARRAGPAGGDIDNHGKGRGEHVLDDLAHGGVEAARGVHAQDDHLGAALPRLLQAAPDVVAGGGPDGPFDLEQDGGLPGPGVLGPGRQENQEKDQGRDQGQYGVAPTWGTSHLIPPLS